MLLILAGITITTVLGEDGIIAQAKLAAEKTKEAEEQQERDLANLANEIDDILSSDTPDNNLIADGSFDGTVNTPKLGTGMTAITWDANHENEDGTKGDWVEPKTNAEWYDYDSQKWANAVTEKEGVKSYWVWIPRYAYRITSGYHQSEENINPDNGEEGAGEIQIVFLKNTTNEAEGVESTKIVENLTTISQTAGAGPSTNENEYVVHPAFTNKPENGGWNAELTGIWVAKYEASRSNAKIENGTITEGTSDTLSVRPSVTSWRSITVSDSYDKCKAYDSTLNSHLMKNSEWGAVAYLAHSKYGLNGNEIGVNQCKDYITGAGPGTGDSSVYNSTYSYSAETFETTYGYKSTQGKKASTTGNIYGIYDMSGGLWEYVSAYLKGCPNDYTDSLETARTSEPWTVDLYEGTSSTDQDNYDLNNNKYGDAVWETSKQGSRSNSWYQDNSYFPYSSNPVFLRGGGNWNVNDAGLFCFGNDVSGDSDSSTCFRPVLVTL